MGPDGELWRERGSSLGAPILSELQDVRGVGRARFWLGASRSQTGEAGEPSTLQALLPWWGPDRTFQIFLLLTTEANGRGGGRCG